jgi:Leucine-rich repeat (LRR) protein
MVQLLLFCVSVCAFVFSVTKSEVPCPFSQECICSGNDGTATKFEVATCTPSESGVPTFNAPRDGFYEIGNNLKVTGRLETIQARAFAAFRTIAGLVLIQNQTPQPVRTQWDPLAFQGPRINSFSVTGLSDVIATPIGLTNLGRNGLESLEINECRESVRLVDNSFKDFKTLGSFSIFNTTIWNIERSAFAGLEPLTVLGLTMTDLSDFPREPLATLKALRILDLSQNGMRNFPQSAFSIFPNIWMLILNENDLNAAVLAKAFDNLPNSLSTLLLQNGGLTSVPTQILQPNNKITTLSLANNQITAIRNNNFAQGGGLTSLNLNNNPINSIEQGSLQQLSKCQTFSLDNTRLASFDLSFLNGMNGLEKLTLVNSGVLLSLSATNADQVPQNISRIEIMNSALQTISQNVEKVISRQNFEQLDISGNTNINCDQNINWIARYTVCPQNNQTRVAIENTKCKDGTPFINYLQKACQGTAEPSTAPPTTTPTSSADISRTLWNFFIAPIIVLTAFKYE